MFALKKSELISKYRRSDLDTGSVEVQCAVFTDKLNSLVEHLKIHRKDNSCRRGLIKLVGRRRRALQYIESRFGTEYKNIFVKKLENLRRESA